jgi:hypothetical protein
VAESVCRARLDPLERGLDPWLMSPLLTGLYQWLFQVFRTPNSMGSSRGTRTESCADQGDRATIPLRAGVACSHPLRSVGDPSMGRRGLLAAQELERAGKRQFRSVALQLPRSRAGGSIWRFALTSWWNRP